MSKRFIASLFLLGFLLGCAPVSRDPELSEEAAPAPKRPREVASAPTRAADIRLGDGGEPASHPEEMVRVDAGTPKGPGPGFDPSNPDWELRFRILYDHYLDAFHPPAVGQPVEIVLASGQARRGVLEALGEDSLVLNIGAGLVTFAPESLNESTRARFFAKEFARLSAVSQGRSEHAAWRERQEAARRPPPPAPIQERPQQIARTDLGTRPHRNNPNASPPRNEEPAGRVSQVDQYIRQNAAIPHSLRIESWGRVQPDGEGYRVRVQYSLQGAEGFGRSREDMVFFMHADGTVYRRAHYRGN